MNSSPFKERIFKIRTDEEFNQLALEIYDFQKKESPVYSEYIRLLNRPEPKNYFEIPFLPIGFFKDHQIITQGLSPQLTFLSSGTTGMTRSAHFVAEKRLYEMSFENAFRQFIGQPEEMVILALLPNYLEQGDSSLVYMVDHLISLTESELSGFVLHEPDQIVDRYETAMQRGKKVVIFGVSYALLDLAESGKKLPDAYIVETGGMKGRRKEMTKPELHAILKKGLQVSHIGSEYGMTELLSQAYSDKNGIFHSPPWMKILIRDINDPLSIAREGKTGGINVIDLANLYSCSFISTQDLGRSQGHSFEVLGRFDNADIRGCNLMVE